MKLSIYSFKRQIFPGRNHKNELKCFFVTNYLAWLILCVVPFCWRRSCPMPTSENEFILRNTGLQVARLPDSSYGVELQLVVNEHMCPKWRFIEEVFCIRKHNIMRYRPTYIKMQRFAFRAQLDSVADSHLLLSQFVGSVPRIDDVTSKLHLVEGELRRAHDARDRHADAVRLRTRRVPGRGRNELTPK